MVVERMLGIAIPSTHDALLPPVAGAATVGLAGVTRCGSILRDRHQPDDATRGAKTDVCGEGCAVLSAEKADAVIQSAL